MKHFLVILLLSCSTIINAQNTAIPDANFEQELISQGIDTGVVNGIVLTSFIDTVTYLNVFNWGITDLTGIEDFTSLTYLGCAMNGLTSLDVSQNVLLDLLDCSNNQITELNLTQNTSLTFIACLNNELTCLNVKNGNNVNVTNFYATQNPNLPCIEVDNVGFSSTNWSSDTDPASSFSTNCPSQCSVGIEELPTTSISIYPNPTTGQLSISFEEGTARAISISNSLGQLLLSDKIKATNQVSLDLSTYPTGIYFLQLEVDGQMIIKKIVKE
ncbi:MAG: hypothetical protein COA97_06190 [Flavobacteriales bacterium]|nr:MAG: hypothetical protein COA97_06190 [Flavobacteriales bacterium]